MSELVYLFIMMIIWVDRKEDISNNYNIICSSVKEIDVNNPSASNFLSDEARGETETKETRNNSHRPVRRD